MSPLLITLFESKGDAFWACMIPILLEIPNAYVCTQRFTESKVLEPSCCLEISIEKERPSHDWFLLLHRSGYPGSPTNSRIRIAT